MATRQGTQVNDVDGRVVYKWAGLTNATTDVGSAAGVQGKAAEYAVQAIGTFGAAGSAALQGSNDGSTWFALDDVNGTAIAMTTNKLWRVSYMPRFVRPAITAGDGTTNLTVYLIGTLR